VVGIALPELMRIFTVTSLLNASASGGVYWPMTAVPAAGVIGESMVALVLAGAMREKVGGDSLGEMKRNFEGYREQLRGY